MPEHEPLVLAYSHLRDFPRAPEALLVLRKVASLVKPLMRARRWKVGELAEFFPDQPNLLGLNINRGQRILLRLRYPGDATQFLPLEQVADTLLHELAHIVHGPHDATFHALWNQLRDEHMALALKGYTGEGFLSEGHRLGSGGSTTNRLQRSVPMQEARRLARAAAERRRAAAEKSSRHRHGHHGRDPRDPGHRLGGSSAAPPPRRPSDLRSVIADAVTRRNPETKPKSKSSSSSRSSHRYPSTDQTLQGCATASGPDSQVTDQTRSALAEQASRNGFRTQAEEDAANDAAIAQALWELVQEDERERLGERYVPPTAERPEGSGGGWLTDAEAAEAESVSSAALIDDEEESDDDGDESSGRSGRDAHGSRDAESSNGDDLIILSSDRDRSATPTPSAFPPPPPPPAGPPGWTCGVCTLHNPSGFLCCDACGSERPAAVRDDKGKGKDKDKHSSSKSGSHHSSSSSSRKHGSSSSHRSGSSKSLPPPPPPRRSSALSNAAAAATARAQQAEREKLQKKSSKAVAFTPSTRGGSMSTSSSSKDKTKSSSSSSSRHSSASTSTLASRPATNNPFFAPPPLPPPPPNGYGHPPAAAAWMCSRCWRMMGREWPRCDMCGHRREGWQ